MKIFCLISFLCLFGFSAQRSTPRDSHYVGAVVEYMENENSNDNLQNYVQLIHDAAIQNVDIIVFPELTLTLTDYVEVPINGLLKDYPIPADKPELYSKFLVEISSAAQENEMYVLINVEEVLNCTSGDVAGESCPEQKVYIFNTNVVFDRYGAIIDRYRKINLFGEPTRTPAFSPDFGIFDTDFAVTFGHFVFFDMLFQVPAIQMVQNRTVTNILIPVRWNSEMPFLTAVSIQQAYASTMRANVLAAGVNNVGKGSTGSGIYSSTSGSLVSLMTGVPTTRLLVSRIPKVPGRAPGTVPGPIHTEPEQLDSLQLFTDQSLPFHTTRLLSPDVQNERTLFTNDVICMFDVRYTEREAEHKYRYRVAAFSGVRTYDWVASGGSRLCAVYACTNSSIHSCGQRFPIYSENSTGVFETLSITAAVPRPETDATQSRKAVYFPVVLDKSLMPINTERLIFDAMEIDDISDTHTIYIFNLRNVRPELYTFGIWGREYTTDGQTPVGARPAEPPGGGGGGSSCSVLPLQFILLLLISIVAFAL